MKYVTYIIRLHNFGPNQFFLNRPESVVEETEAVAAPESETFFDFRESRSVGLKICSRAGMNTPTYPESRNIIASKAITCNVCNVEG